ncbi:F-box protein At1g70590-like isoform X2 [Salvia splendens]|uniref:F-box protein At1g70590-like isoform X2 n=1 Tax=Salvia splendens TaxID=180675 RepID=UPI001C26D1B2|nr:F-box protein At1g70590-like isoform X2 [Salvia splendens]XP_042006704.1 F-box protein At1g70590-like isoform X2 [Salvia splendens]
MKQMTWPCNSDGHHHFASLPFFRKPQESPILAKPSKSHLSFFNSAPKSAPNPPQGSDFSALPYDVLARIAASFALPSLKTASLVCRAWRDALKPLREAMVFLKWGKRFKHGRGGVKANSRKALDSFLKGAARGSTLAMVDAGLIYWEMGKKEEGIAWYRLAAELGDPTGQCNLAIFYFQGNWMVIPGFLCWPCPCPIPTCTLFAPRSRGETEPFRSVVKLMTGSLVPKSSGRGIRACNVQYISLLLDG